MLKYVVVFFQRNGVSGLLFEKVMIIRGGYEKFPSSFSHSEPTPNSPASGSLLSPEQENLLSKIANDPRISQSQKHKIMTDLAKAKRVISEQLKRDRYLHMLRLANEHVAYSQTKRKLPFILGSIPMFSELTTHAMYRAVGSASAPYTIGTYFGMALPCFVFFSMAEMVAPDGAKQTCKILKWFGGAPIWLFSEGLDKATAGIETRVFGEPIPADIQTFTGTVPSEADFKSMANLVDAIRDKAATLPSKFGAKTYTNLDDLARVPLRDVLDEVAKEEAFKTIREGTLERATQALDEAFTPTS